MKRYTLGLSLSASALIGLALWMPGPALAAIINSCAAVNAICNSVTATECVVNQVQTLAIPANGTFTCTVDRTLHIDNGGQLVVAPGSGTHTLNLNVAGDLLMEPTARITGDTAGAPAGNTQLGATLNIDVVGKVRLKSDDPVAPTNGARITANQNGGSCSGGHAGVINLTSHFEPAAAGDFSIDLEKGTVVSTNGNICPAGDITITAPPKGAVAIDGTVESAVDGGLTGNGRNEDGGPITVIGGCTLVVTGKVSSRGQDNGADRVHLEAGCTVDILGLVESIGSGHVGQPNNVCWGPTRPDKPSNSTACVEIWSGQTVTIDGASGAEVRADTGGGSGSTGTSWVDIFAVEGITILGPGAANLPFATNFVVHANGNGGTSDNGGVIQVKSATDKVVLNGPALQASARGNGGRGGDILVEAKLDIDFKPSTPALTDGLVEAAGTNTGASAVGGHVTMRSFGDPPATGSILANDGNRIDVTGGPNTGTVALTACGAVDFPPGDIVPATLPPGNVSITTGTCGGSPGFQAYVVFPPCACDTSGPGPGPGRGDCLKSSVRQVLAVDGRFPNNSGPDIVVKVQNGDSIQNAVNTVTDANNDGYLIILVVARDNGLLGGTANQSVDITRAYPLPFGLLACSVTMVGAAPNHNQPTGHIATTASAPQPQKNGLPQPGNIFVMDLHGSKSTTAGWQVNGDGRYLRNVNTMDNQGDGVQINGNNNTQKSGRSERNDGYGVIATGSGNLLTGVDAFDNGKDGVRVIGNNNTVDDVDSGERNKPNDGDGVHVEGNGNALIEVSAYSNGGHGVFVKGNSNQITKSDGGAEGKANARDGLHVEGNTNTLQENEAFANGGDGINLTGSGNTLKKNRTGDGAGTGNAKNGITVSGGNNTLDGNKAHANGVDGFRVSAGANKLKNNESNPGSAGGTKANKACQYNFADGSTLDQNGNKINNASFVGAGSVKRYTAGCKN